MIRRQVGNEYRLISQHEHALLSGRMAARLGNARFDRPEPFDQTVEAIALHDCGWPIHDDRPTLNSQGIPLDVFDPAPAISLKVWSASVERAMDRGPYVGLLVSLHVLALSSLVVAADKSDSSRSSEAALRRTFEMNKFQHRQIEIQEESRRQLSLHTDRALTIGLDEGSDDPRERALTRNLRILQLMDYLSLAICREVPPDRGPWPAPWRVGHPACAPTARRVGDDLTVEPWPFECAEIVCRVPYRAVAAERYDGQEAFARAYAAAPVKWMEMAMREG